MTITTGSQRPVIITTPSNGHTVLVGKQNPTNVTVGMPGPRGLKGDKGDEGGTPVVAVPYDAWPPVDPQPDTLYLRLAP